MDSVSDAALKSGAELLVHAYRGNGDAPGAARAQALGVPFEVVPAMGISEDVALLLAYEKGAELIVAVGHALQPDRVHGAEPRGDVVDVPDAAAGGGDPRRREGRVPARLAAGRPVAAGRAGVTGLGAIVVAVVASPGVEHLIELIVLRVRDWLGLG